jgi:multicomponent Na+:H+ antiporter subunit G
MAVSGIAVAILLGLAVLSAWVGCWGFLRFSTALDRLHCASFVNAAAGFSVAVAVVVQDGASDRTLKTFAILATLLFGGAALNHAVGRAIVLRDGAGP